MPAKKGVRVEFCKVARSLPSNEKAKAGITNDGWTGEGEEEELKRKEAFFISYPLLFLFPSSGYRKKGFTPDDPFPFLQWVLKKWRRAVFYRGGGGGYLWATTTALVKAATAWNTFRGPYLTEGKSSLEEFAAFSHVFKVLKSALFSFPDYVGRPCLWWSIITHSLSYLPPFHPRGTTTKQNAWVAKEEKNV